MAEEKETTETEEGGSKKKLFIIIGAAVLLLVAGAATAFFLLSGGDDAEEEVAEETVEAIEEVPVPIYHPIPKPKEPGLIVTMLPGTGFKQAQINMTLFTQSTMLKDYLIKNDPMIRHHIINYLSTEKPELFIDRKGREKMQQGLKKKLVDEISASANEYDRLLAEKLENIYFSKFILQ